jgi:dGTPase
MFDNLYTNSIAKVEEHKAELVVEMLFNEYMEHTDMLPDEFRKYIDDGLEDKETVVCDYIAGMTDNYAVAKAKDIFLPRAWDMS